MMQTMYDRIRELRIKNRMSQNDLAIAMGYKDRSMISRIEKGEIDLQQSKIIAFSKILGTTFRYLMDGEKPTEEQLVAIAYTRADDGTKSAVRKLLDIPEAKKDTESFAG